MQLTVELATDYSIQEKRKMGGHVMRRRKWQVLEPWRPFFWGSRLPTGIYLRAMRKPVLLPSGYEVDEEVYFAVLLILMVQTTGLRIHRFAFLKNPERHTQRSVKREGYWHFDRSIATSAYESFKILRNFMNALEILAFDEISLLQNATYSVDSDERFSDSTLNRVVAWEERLGVP